MKQKILNILKFALTAAILYWLYSKGLLDFSKVHGVLTNVKVVTIVFSVLLVCNLAGVVRWQWLLKGQGIETSFGEAFQLTMIGVFFNTALPGAVSGDVVKGYYIVRKQPDGKGRIKAFTTLLLDRILGLSALVFVSFFAMAFKYHEINSNPLLKPLCGLITLIWIGVIVFYGFVLFDSPIARQLQKTLPKLPLGHLFVKFFDAVKAYESCKRFIFKGFAISVAIHLSLISCFILLANALGGFERIPLDKFFFLVPFGMLVTAVPIAPAGLGTGHAAFLGLFQLMNVKSGADLFTAYVSFQLLMSLLGGLVYLKYRGHAPKPELVAPN